MSDIKYEDIYFMIKDVAYDQEDPISAYKKIEEQIIKSESGRDYYKRLAEAADRLIFPLLKIYHDETYKKSSVYQEYNSILQEREGKK